MNKFHDNVHFIVNIGFYDIVFVRVYYRKWENFLIKFKQTFVFSIQSIVTL